MGILKAEWEGARPFAFWIDLRVLTGKKFCYIIGIMIRSLNRKISSLTKGFPVDNGYVEASAQERVAMMWELTEELWSFKDTGHAERRLQRNVANLIRQ